MKNMLIVQSAPSANGTDFLLKRLHHVHKTDGPQSYLFLGSSGGFLRDVRERFLDYTEAIFNDRFKVIDQFVVEELMRNNSNMMHVGRDVLSALVLDVIDEDTNLGHLLNSGNGIVELFMTFYAFTKDSSPENVLAEIDASDDLLLKEFAGLYRKFCDHLATLNLFSTTDAYLMLPEIVANGFYKKGTFAKHLFIDGFNDLSRPIIDFLSRFVHLFEDITIHFPVDYDHHYTDETFAMFINRVVNNSRERDEDLKIDYKLVDPVNDLSPVARFADAFEFDGVMEAGPDEASPVRIARVMNPHEEAQLCGATIKDLVLKGDYNYDEIGVVVRDLKRNSSLLTDVFEEMGVQYRFEGDETLLSSININRLILPFKTFYSGFDPEYLLAMVESGFSSMEDITFAGFEKVFKNARLSYCRNMPTTRSAYPRTIKARQQEWHSKLSDYRDFLTLKLASLQKSVEPDEKQKEELLTEIELVDKTQGVVRSLFNELKKLFGSTRKRFIEEYSDYFRKKADFFSGKGLISEDEFEQIALRSFFEDILPEYKRFMYVVNGQWELKIDPATYWKYLSIILENRRYHNSSFIENRIMIMDLEASRYRRKKIKLYLGFTDRNYPRIRINKITEDFNNFFASPDSMAVQEKSFQREERDLTLSIRNTERGVLFICPRGDISGRPYVPSSFLPRFLKVLKNFKEEDLYLKNEGAEKGLKHYSDYSKKAFLLELLSGSEISNDELFENKRIQQKIERLGYDWIRIKESLNAIEENMATVFTVEENTEALKALFGNTLSPSKYGVLKNCARQFFFKYILRIDDEKEETLGFDFLDEGSILHAVLYRVFKGLSEDDLLLENLDEKAFHQLQKELKTYVETEVQARMFHPEKILFEAELSYFNKMILTFLKKYRNADKTASNLNPKLLGEDTVFKPHEFEKIVKRGTVQLLNEPEIFLTGKIDRIDRSVDGREFLIDYKRSNSSASKDNAYQLLLYSLARNQLSSSEVAGMAFLPIDNKNKKKITGAAFFYDPDENAFLLNGNKKKQHTIDDLEQDIEFRLGKVFDGDFTFSGKPKCHFCGYKDMGLCDDEGGV